METMQPLIRRLTPAVFLTALALTAAPFAAESRAADLSPRVGLGPDALAAPSPAPRQTDPAPHRKASPEATASVSRFCARIRRQLRRGGRASGVFVMDSETNRVLCRSAATRKRILASNMKIFTTATALNRFGPSHRFETSVWRAGRLDGQ